MKWYQKLFCCFYVNQKLECPLCQSILCDGFCIEHIQENKRVLFI